MSFYDYSAVKIDGETVSMEAYRDKVVLVVNTASRCGFTPQYAGLQALYTEYQQRGLEILAFPCNQFARQEPASNPEIADFCSTTFKISFTLFEKVEVNGDKTHPLFRFLKKEIPGLLGGGIKWNFTKFLVDREGRVRARFAPHVKPEKLRSDIEKLL